MVAPRVDSSSAAYRKNKTPCRKSTGLIGHVAPDGKPGKSEIIHAMIQMIMLSIIPAISLRSQWSCS